MKDKNILLALLAILLLSLSSEASAMCSEPGEPEFDDCVMAADAATDWRVIAIYEGDLACPDATGWTKRRLFSGLGELPPGLKNYCVYEAISVGSTVQALIDVSCGNTPPPECLTEFNRDSMSLTQLSTQAIEGLVVNDFNTQFLSHAGAVGPLNSAPQNVRLAVVDTEPSGFNQDRDGPGLSDHGFSLLNLTRRLICPTTGPCGVQLDSELGLPLELCSTEVGAPCECNAAPVTGVCSDPATGGYVGTQSDLALAIFTAVRDWESSGIPRLVINLSVGWEPVYGGQSPINAGSVPIRAVAASLRYAACRGAIAIAAAGNRVPGPSTLSGPLYPAGWESEPAPNETQCIALLGGAPDATTYPVPNNTYHPLVYSAAAINHTGDQIETRSGGEPRLVAFGDHAVTNTFIAPNVEPTAIMTGSSVASAVVSAAAAAAWYHRDGAPGYTIMSQIYVNAPVVPGRTADYCFDLGNGCGNFDVRRVNVCEAVDDVCTAVPGPACPSYTCPTDVPVLAPVPLNGILSAFAGDPAVDVSTLPFSATVPECSANYTLHWSGGTQTPDVPCPHLQYYGIQATPYTDGQPSGQVCEGCINNFASPGKLFIEVKAEFLETLEHVTLLCGDDAYRLPNTLSPGDRLTITQIPAHCEFEEVAVAFRTTRNNVHKASVVSASLQIADRDDDGVQDAADNCYEEANPTQVDTDGDMIGDRCDGDFNNDCMINVIDLGILRSLFFSTNPLADLNADGIVNASDLGLFKLLFFQRPGPSGIPNLCSL